MCLGGNLQRVLGGKEVLWKSVDRERERREGEGRERNGEGEWKDGERGGLKEGNEGGRRKEGGWLTPPP